MGTLGTQTIISLRNVLIPGAGPVLDLRGLIDMIYVGDHKAFLHTKYKALGLMISEKKIF